MEKKVEPDLTKTSPQTTQIFKQRGFTLLELLVVIGIIALITSITLPSVSSYFQISLNSATRDLASVIKEAYHSSVLTGRVYRLCYDLKLNLYWVESGPPEVLLDTKESREKKEGRKWLLSSNSKAAPSPFQLDTTVTRKKMSLPRGTLYEDILTQQNPDPVNDGIAYTHFFPNGMTEQTLIHLKDRSNHHASLTINPILGSTDSYDRYATKDEVFGK